MQQERHFGLDVARGVAVAFVLCGHMPSSALQLPASVGVFFGVFAVELFFVLSGMLIGGILLRESAAGLDGTGLWRFWRQRWLRTLPAYAVATLAAFWVEGRGSWLYLAFAQNPSPEALGLFPVSWSLSVEEWFYLSFPLALLALGRVLPPRRAFLVGVMLFLAVPAVARLALSGHVALTWDSTYRKQVPLRLDAPAFGLLLAWLRAHRPAIWHRLDGRVAALGAGVGVLALGQWLTPSFWGFLEPQDTLRNVALLPLFSLGSALVIVWLHGFPRWPSVAPLRWGVLWLSRLSYALYLVHWYIFLFIGAHMTQWRSPAIAAAALSSALMAALALHWLVERPFLWLRARLG